MLVDVVAYPKAKNTRDVDPTHGVFSFDKKNSNMINRRFKISKHSIASNQKLSSKSEKHTSLPEAAMRAWPNGASLLEGGQRSLACI